MIVLTGALDMFDRTQYVIEEQLVSRIKFRETFGVKDVNGNLLSMHAIVKQVLGEKYYPHFLRLNCLSEIGSDPTANLLRLKSFSGIKSATALNAYLGQSKEEQQKALEFRGKQFH